MASVNQARALIRKRADGDDSRFYALAIHRQDPDGGGSGR